MKVSRTDQPYPIVTIENFVPNESLVRAAAESYDFVESWVKYGGENSKQTQWCNTLGRENIPTAALIVMDYIASNFDPNKVFGLTDNAFPDFSFYGGGMMVTPNKKNEGGYLGMHVDASHHGVNNDWKREYSAILCISEEYDSSFDLKVHNGKSYGNVSYKFNQLNVFKCSKDSWHGLPEITKGKDRKTLGVMYWSKDKKGNQINAKFNDNLEFD